MTTHRAPTATNTRRVRQPAASVSHQGEASAPATPAGPAAPAAPATPAPVVPAPSGDTVTVAGVTVQIVKRVTRARPAALVGAVAPVAQPARDKPAPVRPNNRRLVVSDAVRADNAVRRCVDGVPIGVKNTYHGWEVDTADTSVPRRPIIFREYQAEDGSKSFQRLMYGHITVASVQKPAKGNNDKVVIYNLRIAHYDVRECQTVTSEVPIPIDDFAAFNRKNLDRALADYQIDTGRATPDVLKAIVAHLADAAPRIVHHNTLGWKLDNGNPRYLCASGITTDAEHIPARDAVDVLTSPDAHRRYVDAVAATGAPTNSDIDTSVYHRLLATLTPAQIDAADGSRTFGCNSHVHAAIMGAMVRCHMPVVFQETPAGAAPMVIDVHGPSGAGKTALINFHLNLCGNFHFRAEPILASAETTTAKYGFAELRTRPYLPAQAMDRKETETEPKLFERFKTIATLVGDGAGGGRCSMTGELLPREPLAGLILTTGEDDPVPQLMAKGSAGIVNRVMSLAISPDHKADKGISREINERRNGINWIGHMLRRWIAARILDGTLQTIVAGCDAGAREYVDARWPETGDTKAATNAEYVVSGLMLFSAFVKADAPNSFLPAWIADEGMPAFMDAWVHRAAHATARVKADNSTAVYDVVIATLRSLVSTGQYYISVQKPGAHMGTVRTDYEKLCIGLSAEQYTTPEKLGYVVNGSAKLERPRGAQLGYLRRAPDGLQIVCDWDAIAGGLVQHVARALPGYHACKDADPSKAVEEARDRLAIPDGAHKQQKVRLPDGSRVRRTVIRLCDLISPASADADDAADEGKGTPGNVVAFSPARSAQPRKGSLVDELDADVGEPA